MCGWHQCNPIHGCKWSGDLGRRGREGGAPCRCHVGAADGGRQARVQRAARLPRQLLHIEALFGRVYGGRMVEGYDMMVEGYDVMALGSKCSGSGKP